MKSTQKGILIPPTIKEFVMKNPQSIISIFFMVILMLILVLSGCKSMNKTQKGAVIGTAGGAATGAVIGKVAGNTALGAIIGAAVGGVTGAVIGRKMDKQAEEMKNQIPDAKIERVGEGIVIEFSDKILFDFDQSKLSPESRKSLTKLASILKSYPDTDIEVQGHTDDKGTDKYNLALSKRRAAAVYGNLTESGVALDRISTKGFGETLPKYANNSGEGALNRRVEFLITANEKMKAESANEAAQK